MHLNRRGVVFAAILLPGTATGAAAQIPNPFDWLFPHKEAQPTGNNQPQGNDNNGHCSVQPQTTTYLNDCGELIPGQQEPSPVHG
jgi:hypothetical protein